MAVAGLCAGSLSSCGGSSAPPLTHAQLIAQADAICGRANRQLDPSRVHGLSSRQIDRRALRILDSETSQLRGLRPGRADAASYGRFVTAYARQRPLMVAFQRQERSGDDAAPLGRLFVQLSAAGAAASSLGATSCGLTVSTLPASSAQTYRTVVTSECFQLTSAIGTIPKPSSAADLAVWDHRLDPVLDQAIRDLRAARPAPGQVSMIALAAQPAGLRSAVDATGAALTAGDTAAIPADIRKVGAATTRFDSSAHADGLQGCRL